jgi:predicted RNA-binding Zn-ribbon protein involved in translation (DUF1610 family)
VPISVTCPSCGVTLKTSDAAAGKKAKCPKCQGPIVVPMPRAELDPIEDAPAPDDAWGDFDQESEIASTTPAVAGEDRKPCPACGEMIHPNAAKCRFCGEYFDADLEKAEKKSNRSKGGGRDGDMSTGDWVVAILCSGIGCIAGIVWMIQGKPKGKKMLLVSLAVQGILTILQVLVAAANQGAP